MGVQHLPSSVLHILSCKLGASLGALYLAHMCTAYAIKYIRSLTWVYCICHQMYCIHHHLTSGATLGCTALAIKCTAEAMCYFMSPTWVYCICYQVYCRYSHIQYIRSPTWVYCISYHVNQEPHLVYCICQQVYCICHHVHVHREPRLGVLYLPAGALDLP